MSNYDYQDGTFSSKDALPPGSPAKVIKGSDFETQFQQLRTAVNSKANSANPVITGRLTGGIIDGGTYEGGTP